MPRFDCGPMISDRGEACPATLSDLEFPDLGGPALDDEEIEDTLRGMGETGFERPDPGEPGGTVSTRS